MLTEGYIASLSREDIGHAVLPHGQMESEPKPSGKAKSHCHSHKEDSSKPLHCRDKLRHQEKDSDDNAEASREAQIMLKAKMLANHLFSSKGVKYSGPVCDLKKKCNTPPWMNLDIMLREISQSPKDKNCMILLRRETYSHQIHRDRQGLASWHMSSV